MIEGKQAHQAFVLIQLLAMMSHLVAHAAGAEAKPRIRPSSC